MKRVFLYFLVVICLVNIDIEVIGQNTIALDDTKSNLCVSSEVLESNSSEYIIRFEISKLRYDNVKVENYNYQKIKFDSYCSLQNIGEPDLPTISKHIGIPTGCSIDIKLKETKWRDVSVGKIYPAQFPPTSNCLDIPFVISDSIYNSDEYLCPLIQYSDIQNWKGIENTFITICPFIYHPNSNLLSVLTDFTLFVTFTRNANKIDMPQRYSEEDLLLFDNKNFICCEDDSNRIDKSGNTCDYLIIVGNIPEIENSQSMAKFRRWKALKGYKTKLVSTSDIGSDSTSIKNYIAQQYGVSQVLFVGNNEKIPVAILPPWHYQSSSGNTLLKSDYWYGCLGGSGDLEADIPVGRFLTNNLNDFANMVNKTIKYESLYHEWSNRNLLVSHEETHNFQETLDSISNMTFSHPLSFYKAYGATVAMGGLGSDKYDVIDFINNGMNIVTINCHGNAGGFWMFNGDNSTFSYEDRTLLGNETYPIFFSNACYNGDFTNYIHSIASYFSCSNHCSTAYLGTTMASYIFPGNQYLLYLYQNLLNNNIYNLGNLILTSHIMNLGYGNIARDNAFNYICGGDPSLEIWTGYQNYFEDVTISPYGNYLRITVSNVDSFKVNVVSDEGVLLGKYYSSGNYLYIPKMSNSFEIAIDKHNYIPYIVHVDTDNLYIQNKTFTENEYYVGTPMSIGYDVTSTQSYGNVIVDAGAKIIINKGSGVIIKNGFECKQGAEFIVK